MDLLSYLGELNRRKDSLMERARDLYREHGSVEKMESEMAERNYALVLRLRQNKIRFSEFQRVAADETVTAAAAGMMSGLKSEKLDNTQFASCSAALPYLWKFFAGIETAKSMGRLEEEPEYEEDDEAAGVAGGGALTVEQILENYGIDTDDLEPDDLQELIDQVTGDASPGASIPASWQGVESRLGRYLVTPIYGAAAAGGLALAQNIGYREMRRVARLDKKTCEDCRMWDSMGWVPIGLLPPPGQRCRCHDNCRCYIDYR